MTGKYLKFLCTQIEPGCGVVPKIDGRVQPVAAIYPGESAIDFRNALTGADFSLQSLVRDLVMAGKVREISVPEQEKKLFLNLNAPSDLPLL
jgi:molybdopterin-guanine dinucleotide biosynthesis protein A